MVFSFSFTQYIYQFIHPLNFLFIYQSLIHQSVCLLIINYPSSLFIYPSIRSFFIFLFIHPSIHLFVNLSVFMIHPSIHSSIHPFVNLSVYLSIHHPSINTFIHPSIYLSIHSLFKI